MRFKKAVLVIHGFSGQLADNEFLVNHLQANYRFDVFAFTLPAHEKNRIHKVKYQEWIDAVCKQIEFLIQNKYRKIYVVGHSMGGVLAGYLASHYKEIKKIVFLSSAYDYIGKNQIIDDLKNFNTIRKDHDISYSNIISKITKVSFLTILEFKKIVKELRTYLKDIKIPALILHGSMDEVVPCETVYYIEKEISSKDKTITIVLNARHNILRGKRKDDVIIYIEAFLIGGRKWKQVKKSEL